MKTITIAGNVGKDAEIKTTQSGDKFAAWTVAVEDRGGREKVTYWFDCTLWGKRGDALAQYITKGSRVCVSGELTRREYEGKTYLGIMASNVTLLGGGEPREGTQHSDGYGPGSRASADPDDEIPF